jgi:hypothetical protein
MVDKASGSRSTSRLRTADPKTLPDGRWSEGRWSRLAPEPSDAPDVDHPDHPDLGLDGLIVYPDADLILTINAYPALTRAPFGKEAALHNGRVSSVISIWWAHKDSNLGPAD